MNLSRNVFLQLKKINFDKYIYKNQKHPNTKAGKWEEDCHEVYASLQTVYTYMTNYYKYCYNFEPISAWASTQIEGEIDKASGMFWKNIPVRHLL